MANIDMKQLTKKVERNARAGIPKNIKGDERAQLVEAKIAEKMRTIHKVLARFKEVMRPSDTELRIRSSNQRSNLEGDIAYGRASENPKLHVYQDRIEKRQLDESDYNWLVVDGSPSPHSSAYTGTPSCDAVTILKRAESSGRISEKAWKAASERKD